MLILATDSMLLRKEIQMKTQSIKIKIVSLLILLLLFSILTMGFIAYYTNNVIQNQSMEQATNAKVEQVKKMIEDRESNLEITIEALNKNLIMTAKMIENKIRNIEADALNLELKILTTYLGIDEIHVVDDKGVLAWSNKMELIGYDYADSEQSKVFLKGLEDKNFQLVQEPTPRGADQVLFQYIGVARQDQKGVVQIGIEPTELQELIEKIHVSGIAKATSDANVSVAILDLDGNFISHTDTEFIGKNIESYEFADQIMGKENGGFTYMIGDHEKRLSFEKYRDYYIIGFTETQGYTNNVNYMLKMMLIASAIIFLLAGIISYRIAGRISNPIMVLSQIIERLSNYDLQFDETSEAIKYLKRKDEIGTITKATAKMQKNFIELIKNISFISQQVATSSQEVSLTSQQSSTSAEEVARTIEEIANGASEQAKDTERAATEVNELGGLINQERHYIKSLNNSTKQVRESKDEGLQAVEQLVKKSEENNAIAAEIAGIIITTNEEAEKIQQASQMIKSIADQTNLLALNAAIEAARAGESGRGFSVVADEIRQLAEQSDSFAEQIVFVIKELSAKTQKGVERMQEAGKIVEEQSQNVEITNEKFMQIADAIDKMKKILEEIDVSSDEMENKKNNMISIIENLSSISEENAAGTEETSASVEEQTAAMEQITYASEELAKLAEEMHLSISKFKY